MEKENKQVIGIHILLIIILLVFGLLWSEKDVEASGPSDRAIERIVNALESQAESLKAIKRLLEREDRRRR